MSSVRIFSGIGVCRGSQVLQVLQVQIRDKLQKNNPAKIYLLSTVFKNMLHCVYSVKSSSDSQSCLTPPTIQEYISGLRWLKIDGEDEDYIPHM